MPTTLSPVSIANLALAKIGAQPINSLLDQTNNSAIQCNNNWQGAYLEVIRLAPWSCLLTPAVLVQVPQTAIPCPSGPIQATAWAPNTYYAADTYVTYGAPPYYYQVMWDYTSSNNWANDITSGVLQQTNLPTNQPFFGEWGGQKYPSGWSYQFALPADFQLLVSLNDRQFGWWQYGHGGTDYQIMGSDLYTNECQAVIKYVQNTPDTTRFDSLLTNCIALKLAAMIATVLRQDGGALEMKMTEGYELALKEARTKNAGEKRSRPFSLIPTSQFNRARYGGVNG